MNEFRADTISRAPLKIIGAEGCDSRECVEARSAADRFTDVSRRADQLHQRLSLLLRGAELLARERHLNLRLQRALLCSQDTLNGRIVHS